MAVGAAGAEVDVVAEAEVGGLRHAMRRVMAAREELELAGRAVPKHLFPPVFLISLNFF